MQSVPERMGCRRAVGNRRFGSISVCGREWKTTIQKCLFFVQNSTQLTKGYREENWYSIFLLRGFEIFVSFAYWWREAQNNPGKGGHGCRGQGWQLIPPQHFHHEKEAIDHRFGCSHDRTTYTRSTENGHWRGLHRRRTTRTVHLQSQSHRWKLHRMQYPDVRMTQICTVEVRSKSLQDKDFQTMMQWM